MVDELKALLDVVAGVPELALWALVAFGLFKLVIYLSTAGAIVYCIRLSWESIVDMYKSERPPRKEIKESDFKDFVISHDGTERRLRSLLKSIIGHDMNGRSWDKLFSSDVDWLEEAVEEKITKDREEKKVA